jgi:FPC/CPF motif-containing protein YcgG
MFSPPDPQADAVESQITRIIHLQDTAERDRRAAGKANEEIKDLDQKIAEISLNEKGQAAYKIMQQFIARTDDSEVRSCPHIAIYDADQNRARLKQKSKLAVKS